MEVVSDVIFSANVGQVSMDVPVKFDGSSSNGSQDIQSAKPSDAAFSTVF